MADQQSGTALTPYKQSAQMVAQFANKILNSEKAQAMAAHMAVMARNNPKLAECTPESIVSSMMACVSLDLMPNTPEQLAYIIPYKNHKFNRMEAQFQIGYKGMIELAYRSGAVSTINAELVFPTDKFNVDLGQRILTHEPDLTIDRTDYSKAIAVYAVTVLPNGARAFDVLSKSEIEKVRNVVKAKSSDSPWSTWEESMVKKTAVKRMLKMLPQSSTDNRLQMAANFDSWAQAGKLRFEDGKIVADEKPELPSNDDGKKKEIANEANSIADSLTSDNQNEA